MSDIELMGGDIQEAPKPVETPRVKRKYTRRKPKIEAASKRRKPREEPLPAGWLQGLNSINCCVACGPEKCMITGENVCGHPNKGGLQTKYMSDKAVMGRFGEARLHLAHQEAEGGKGRKF